ncbi:MAG TPA: PLP-dependent aminotransferase family protein [Vicinamibacteria bacterium]|nr:PLP-dependent aminotransferase family protein [Vicinamibacteria bacterium]
MSALIERPGIISFAPGQPSPETFPVAQFREIVNEILEKESAQAFQYVLTRGVGALIQAVTEYARAKGMTATLEQTLITDGSQQGLDLVSRTLLDPGDVALVELPSYIGATSAFRAAQARMVGVRLDEQGLDLEDLRRRHAEERAAGRRVKFLYVVPNFQNPSGISHPVANRRELLRVARELDLLIVEDDPYGDLYFEAEPRPTLKSMDEEGRVLYLASFSKILAPGLRTAFLLGPEEILAKVEIAKQSANLCGSSLDQRIVLSCLRRGLIEEQKVRIRPYYRKKRDAMLEALRGEGLPGVSWTHPAGGLFVWVTLPEGMDAEKLLPTAVEEGVAYVAGAPFFVDDSGANTLRLTFAKEEEGRIREGVARLARAVRAGHS